MNWHQATRMTAIGPRRHPLIVTLMLVTLWSATHALGQGMQFVPIRSAPLGSPPGTIGDPVTPEFNFDLGCWEVQVRPGIDIDLDLQIFGWGDASCSGAPCKLGSLQSTVDSAGFSNGIGGDLHPKGWPADPRSGPYLTRMACSFNGDPCGSSPFDLTCDNGNNGDCEHNPDWVIPACAFEDGGGGGGVGVATMDFEWFGLALGTDCNVDDGTVKTLGGLFLEVPLDALGTYVIALSPDPARTFMNQFSAAPIPGTIALTPACITVADLRPPIRAPAPHDILKNRYISIDPRGVDALNPPSFHIRVMVDNTQVNGHEGFGPWWANDPVPGGGLSPAVCISVVTTTKPAVEPDWSACPVLHLTGCPIIPTTTYALASESAGDLSADALFETQARPGVKWHGDTVGFFNGVIWTPPNGTTNIDEAVAAIKTFQDPSAFNATHLSVTDVHPNLDGTEPNLIVSFADVLVIILGFQGQEYPGPDLTQCP